MIESVEDAAAAQAGLDVGWRADRRVNQRQVYD